MNNTVEGHDIFLKDRKNLVLSGIKEVLTFDEKEVDVISLLGNLSIRGENLKISSFNTDNGNMEISGNFAALIYLNDSSKKEGLFSKLFK